jgi:predicted transcriptional regulator
VADDNDSLQARVAAVAAAYFSNNQVSVAEITAVVEKIGASLRALGSAAGAQTPQSEPESEAERAKLTAAQIRRSITPEALVSFEDGRGYKTLRRHLSVRGLTPEQYREKWGLPHDYPMVSPNYSAARSQMAKSLGLGQLGRQRRAEPAAKPAARRGRARGNA